MKKGDVGRRIGDLAFEAFDKRDRAMQIEEETVKYLEKRLREIAK